MLDMINRRSIGKLFLNRSGFRLTVFVASRRKVHDIALVKHDDITKKIESISCEGGYVLNTYTRGIER